MKNLNLSLCTAILAFFTAGGVAAQDMPTLYGKINVSFNNTDLEGSDPGTDEFRLNSNASRLGVKGNYGINEKIEAVYQLEFEVFADDGRSSNSNGNDTFEQRNIFAGLRGGFGEIIAGRFDTPMKLTEGKVDRFNDLELGDISEILDAQDRERNIVMYTTPDFSGLTIKAAIIPEENSSNDDDEDGPADGVSVSAVYQVDQFYLAVAINTDVDDADTARISGTYQLTEQLNLGFIVQNSEDSGDDEADFDEEDSYVISAEYKLDDNWMLKAQYGMSDRDLLGGGDEEDTQTSIGADYKLNSNSKVYGYLTNVERDRIDNDDDTTIAIGFELKF